jgi:hypothetical protein
VEESLSCRVQLICSPRSERSEDSEGGVNDEGQDMKIPSSRRYKLEEGEHMNHHLKSFYWQVQSRQDTNPEEPAGRHFRRNSTVRPDALA